MKKPLLIATVTAALAAATFSTQASACDPIPGMLIGGGIGAAIGNAPGAAVGAIIGSAITGSAPCYYERDYDRAYAPRRYYDREYYAPPVAYERGYYAPPPVAYYEPAPVYYASAVYYAPAVVYRSYPRYAYEPRRVIHRHYSEVRHHWRGDRRDWHYR